MRSLRGGRDARSSMQAMIAHAQKAWGRIDVLHYNVGVSIAGGDAPPTEITEEAFDRVTAVNLRGMRDGLQARAAGHARAAIRRRSSGISSLAACEDYHTSPTRRPRRR